MHGGFVQSSAMCWEVCDHQARKSTAAQVSWCRSEVLRSKRENPQGQWLPGPKQALPYTAPHRLRAARLVALVLVRFQCSYEDLISASHRPKSWTSRAWDKGSPTEPLTGHLTIMWIRCGLPACRASDGHRSQL